MLGDVENWISFTSDGPLGVSFPSRDKAEAAASAYEAFLAFKAGVAKRPALNQRIYKVARPIGEFVSDVGVYEIKIHRGKLYILSNKNGTRLNKTAFQELDHASAAGIPMASKDLTQSPPSPEDLSHS